MRPDAHATDPQIARWARRMAREAGKLRAAGDHEGARRLVARCADAVEAVRAERRAA